MTSEREVPDEETGGAVYLQPVPYDGNISGDRIMRNGRTGLVIGDLENGNYVSVYVQRWSRADNSFRLSVSEFKGGEIVSNLRHQCQSYQPYALNGTDIHFKTERVKHRGKFNLLLFIIDAPGTILRLEEFYRRKYGSSKRSD